MGPAYLPDRKKEFLEEQGCLDELPLRADEYSEDGYSDDEQSDNLLSLLEENARLRQLVVKLTDLVLKNVTDRR